MTPAAELEQLAGELVAAQRRAEHLRLQVLERMAAAGLTRIDVRGAGRVQYVKGGPSSAVDSHAAAERLARYAKLLRELGVHEADGEMPRISSERRPSVRVTLL